MCCRNISRSILVITNLLFVLFGIALIIISGYMMNVPDMVIQTFSSPNNYNGLAIAIIVCGGVILLIAGLGCCGVTCCRENKALLCLYATLIILSVIVQLVFVGYLYHIHESLSGVENSSINTLSESDVKVLHWIQDRFYDAYDDCDPTINLQRTLEEESIVLECHDERYEWFVTFAAEFCLLKPQEDLIPKSTFMKCAGSTNVNLHNFMISTFTKSTVFCSCEAHIIQWIDKQSIYIGTALLVVGVLEFVLICLSCMLLCNNANNSHRHRHDGYEEITTSLVAPSSNTTNVPYAHAAPVV